MKNFPYWLMAEYGSLVLRLEDWGASLATRVGMAEAWPCATSDICRPV
jgi:hypothetical protein